MKNRTKLIFIVSLILLFFLLMIYFSSYFKKPNIEEINNCNFDIDCIMVSKGICGGALAINNDYIVSWNKYLDRLKIIYKNVICKPTLSPDLFDAKCINNKCERIIRVQNLE